MSSGTSKRAWSRVGPERPQRPRPGSPAPAATRMPQGRRQVAGPARPRRGHHGGDDHLALAAQVESSRPGRRGRARRPTTTMGTARASVALRLLGVPTAPRMSSRRPRWRAASEQDGDGSHQQPQADRRERHQQPDQQPRGARRRAPPGVGRLQRRRHLRRPRSTRSRRRDGASRDARHPQAESLRVRRRAPGLSPTMRARRTGPRCGRRARAPPTGRR